MSRSNTRSKDQYEELGRLTQGLLHNINNSLAGIGGFAELLIDDLTPDSPDRIFAEKILSSSEHLKLLIKEIWMLNALRRFTPELVVDVGAVLDEILMNVDVEQLASRNIFMEYEAEDNGDVLLALANAEYIKMAVNHLIANALDSFGLTPQRPKPHHMNIIKITMTSDEENIFITLEDNGIGMPENVERDCMMPLFTTKDPSKHHGLGLNIVEAIMKAMGGNFSILSQNGICTTACMMIPRKDTVKSQRQSSDHKQVF